MNESYDLAYYAKGKIQAKAFTLPFSGTDGKSGQVSLQAYGLTMPSSMYYLAISYND
jgi:hypothetical protein